MDNVVLEDIDNIKSELDKYKHTELIFSKAHPFHISIKLPKFESSDPNLNLPKNNLLYAYFLYPQSMAHTNKVFQKRGNFEVNQDYIKSLYDIDLTQKLDYF